MPEKLSELLAAGEGASGHDKAKKQRAALATDKPKMKGKKEVQAAIDDEKEDFKSWRDALRWVLGVE